MTHRPPALDAPKPGPSTSAPRRRSALDRRATLAGLLIGLLAAGLLRIGLDGINEPIAPGCFEYCEVGRNAANYLVATAAVGLVLALGVAFGRRAAQVIALAVACLGVGVAVVLVLALDAPDPVVPGVGLTFGLAALLLVATLRDWA